MRDIVATDQHGSLVWTSHSACAEDHVYSVQSTKPGFRRAARSNLVIGNHVNATPNRAYDYRCQGGSVEGHKIPSLEFCNGAWHTTSTSSYEGKVGWPTVSLVRPYIKTGGYPNVPQEVVATARNRALSQLNSSDVDLGVSIGELGETGKLMRDTTINLIRALNALRKGKVGDAAFYLGLAKVRGKRILRKKDLGGGNIADVLSSKDSVMGLPGGELHNRWLEYQYGWKPLLSDIYNMSQSIQHAFSRPTLGEVRVVHVEDRDLSSHSTTRYEVTGTATVGVEIGLKYRVSDERIAGLSALGLTNPLAVAWELLPLSFVIDWFVSVGDFLSGLGAHHGLTFTTGYETHFTRSHGHSIKDHYYPVNGYEGEPPSWTCQSKAHQRFPSADWPSPGIGVSLNLNLSKLVSLLALAQQRRG
jgi:hypothetical protein